MKQYIEELFEMRSSWVDSSRVNKFDEGLGRLLKELYPDNAHFLYELLQNAEDAKATLVEFRLMDDRLIFEHNGREFVKVDIEGITGIGTTKKKDDLNSIGKFGVGFKAVFSYTNSPHVHCDSCSFAITEMVCPVLLDRPADLREGITRFEFPFDNPEKPCERAVKEVEEGLIGFSSATLLFLQNIREIRWRHSDERKHLKLIEEKGLGKLPVFLMESDSAVGSERWLRLNAPCKEAPEQSVSIAFRLEAGKTEKGKHAFQIVETDGKLCIFFPADKETTNLKFHVHAPFISTVARDSVPYTNEDNTSLRDQLAQLLVNSLPMLRDEGLLTTDFLGVLPNDTDGLNKFYEPFMSAVVETMKTQPLVPIRSGGHEPAERLARSVGRIHEVILEPSLEYLTSRRSFKWVAGVMRYSPADRFLGLLGIDEWGIEQLLEVIEEKWVSSFFTTIGAGDVAWLETMGAPWARKVLFLIAGMKGTLPHWLNKAQIIPASDNLMRVGNEVVFPVGDDVKDLAGVHFLHPEILVGDQEQKNNLKELLKEFGVIEVSEKHSIQGILHEYYEEGGRAIEISRHIKHMKRFVEYWKTSGDVELFKGFCMFLTDNQSPRYTMSDRLYLDLPLCETGLGILWGKTLNCLSGTYHDLAENLDDFLRFSKSLGVKSTILPSKCDVEKNPQIIPQYGTTNYRCPKQDWKLPDVMRISITGVAHRLAVSKIVWNMMSSLDGKYLSAVYQKNTRRETQRAPSLLVQQLSTLDWIPSSDGRFQKPCKMTRDQLPDEFVYDNKNGWLTAIGFGDDAKKRAEKLEAEEFERQEATKRLRNDGINLSHEEMVEFSGFSSEERREILEEMRKKKRIAAFPEATSKDPGRRAEKTVAGYDEAPVKSSEKRERAVRASRPNIDPKPYLQDLYTNDEEQLVCQMCELEMPFKLRNREYHFEAVQIFDDVPKETHQVYLAMCPICAAKYKLLVKKHDACIGSFKRAILSIEDALVFSIDMRDSNLEPLSVRFTETHLLDVRTILGEETDG